MICHSKLAVMCARYICIYHNNIVVSLFVCSELRKAKLILLIFNGCADSDGQLASFLKHYAAYSMTVKRRLISIRN